MRKSWLAVSMILAVLLVGPRFLHAVELKVLTASPKGSLAAQGRQEVSLTFNQPVAALGQESAFSSADCPLTITPAVKGTCRYVGTQTLVFEPAENWPAATEFSVQLAKDFTSRVSGEKLTRPYVFSFSTQLPQVRTVRPSDEEHWLSLTPTLYGVFTMPMSIQQASQKAYLKDPAGKKVALSARPLTKQEEEAHFAYWEAPLHALAFTPVRPLEKNTQYTWVLEKGWASTLGPLGLAEDYQTHFVTYPSLKVLGVKKEGCLPYVPQIRFSSPVRMRELMAAIKVSPEGAVKPLQEYELEQLGYDRILKPFSSLKAERRQQLQEEYQLTPQEQQNGTAFFQLPLSFLNLQPGQRVTVTLDKNLQDIYGGRLGREYTFVVENDGYCPAVEFNGGFGVLESYLPARLPLEIINISSLPVRAARFNKENYIPFLNQTRSSYCQATSLQDPTYQGEYSFSTVKDRGLGTYLDLSRFKPTAQDSLVFSQLQVPSDGHKDGCWVTATENITNLGITFKTSPDTILLWVTSLETGDPVPNLAVELRDKTNTILWSGSTDMYGLARAPGWKQLDIEVPSWGNPTLYAFISSPGGDGFISTELNDGLEPWRFNIRYSYDAQSVLEKIYLFTERGLYRPGEKVYLKGVVRHLQQGNWAIPAAQKGKLTIYDPAGNEWLTKTLTSSTKEGSFDLEISLPASARTGTWEAVFTPEATQKDPSSSYCYFQVQTAKPAEFTIALQAGKKGYVAGEEARFTAAANYQFGTPVAEAAANWTLRRENTRFEPEGFDKYIFTPGFLMRQTWEENGKLILSSRTKTDEKGAVSLTTRLPETENPLLIFTELGVQSPARQELFSRTSVLLHPASFYLGSKVMEEYAQAGKPVSADIVAVTTEGKRTEAAVTARIYQEKWNSVRKVGLSGRLEWVSEKETIELPNQSFYVGKKGASFSFVAPQSGSYYVVLSAVDENGRKVTGGFEVMVYGKGGPVWARQEDDFVPLQQDKNTYRVGQKARIQVRSPYDKATALVTIEREGVLEAWTTTLKGGADYVDVPIKENYLPNVYVGVTLVKGRSAAPVSKGTDLGKPQGKIGYVNLKVEPAEKKLDVKVKTDKQQYRPGEEVVVTLSTRLAKKGVPAEVTLFVVDEGVLALTGYKTPNLFDVFYEDRPLSVFTADNRAYVVGQRNFGEKGENRGGGGAVDSKLGGTDLRSRFSFVPYYQANVKTDSKGNARVTFVLPDNLTRFRVMAVAAREQEFGSAETEIKVSKPLMVTANLPPIVRQGDTFQCSAVVYNYADKKEQLTARIVAGGSIRLQNGEEQEISVPLGKAKEISWPCVATHNGTGEIAYYVEGRKEKDGVKTGIKVIPVEQKQTLTVTGDTSTQQEELLDKPGNINPSADNKISLTLASTALLNVKGAVAYLLSYPYECLEQQLSKIRPIIESEKLVSSFQLGDMTQWHTRAQQVLETLPDYQYATGGFSYWKGGLPDPYVTAYALQVAFQARQAGFSVPQKNLQQAADWLEKAFNQGQLRAYDYSSYEVETVRAYSVYALALYGKKALPAFNNLYAKRVTLPLPATAYLLKAAAVLKLPENIRQNLAQLLLNRITYTPKYAYFTVSDPMPWLHMNDVSSTALALEALLSSGTSFTSAPKTVAWLLGQLNAQGNWNSTNENAVVFSALNQYYQAYEDSVPDFTAAVFWNGQPGLSAHFQGHTLQEQREVLALDNVYKDDTETRVKLEKTGIGRLYYTLSQTYEPRVYTQPVHAGFEITRQITTLDGEPVSSLQAGQRYYVVLTVRTAAARHFVVLEDFLPAGVDIVNTSLATETAVTAEHLPAEKNSRAVFDRMERYEDRMAAFADYMPAGTHTFSYLIHAARRGTFAYPSAWVNLMYDSAVFGRNASSTLEIR